MFNLTDWFCLAFCCCADGRCCHISFCTHFVCPKSHESIDVLCLLPLTLLCVVFDITSEQNDLSKITNANKMKKTTTKTHMHTLMIQGILHIHTHTGSSFVNLCWFIRDVQNTALTSFAIVHQMLSLNY